jgi:uncharacterized protein (TIGR04255 family)
MNQAQIPVGMPLPPELLQVFLGGNAARSHEFSSVDGRSRISLTRDFLAFTDQAYSDWGTFYGRLVDPLRALVEIYSPAFFTRIGLRYRDRIDRGRLSLTGVPWARLLRPEIAGELGYSDGEPFVRHALREIVFDLPDHAGNLRVVHGLDPEAPSAAFIVDSDFYVEKQIPSGGEHDVLDDFNRRAGNFFRWCITKDLHAAMRPEDP